MKTMILSSFLLAGLSGAALAQAAATDFASLDADLSAGLNLAEVQGAWPDVTAEIFAEHDLDANGELSADEYAALAAAAAGTPAS